MRSLTPQQAAGNALTVAVHHDWDAFMKLVTEGENSFADNPPNAAVSIVGAKGDVTEVVVTLSKRPLVNDNLESRRLELDRP